MRRVANPADGSVILPNDMQYWNPGDNGNILFKITNPLKLFFVNWLPPIGYIPPQKDSKQLNESISSNVAQNKDNVALLVDPEKEEREREERERQIEQLEKHKKDIADKEAH